MKTAELPDAYLQAENKDLRTKLNYETERRKAGEAYIQKLQDELTGQLVDGGALDVNGLNKYMSLLKSLVNKESEIYGNNK